MKTPSVIRSNGFKKKTCAGWCFWNGRPISITPPTFVELRVAQTDPGVRGDTATGGSKVAVLTTGASVRVPLFIEEGEALRIDTRNGEYVGRAKG